MAQYVYRRPPYPAYDIEGIESWLEDLISDGLWLDKDGYVFGFMQFQPGAPKHLKYRLEPIEKINMLSFAQPSPPSQKAVELYEEFGWEYLGTFSDFYIYRSVTEHPIELNTDPMLQAQALGHVRRRSSIALAVAFLFVFGFSWFLWSKWPMIRIIEYGWKPFAVTVAILVFAFLYSAISYLHTVSLQKKLLRGESLTRTKNWRQGNLIRRILLALPFALFILSSYLNATSTSAIYDNEIDPSAYADPLPFVTSRELAPDRDLEHQFDPMLSSWSTPLTPYNLYWLEDAKLSHPQEALWTGELQVHYHEAKWEWIAKRMIQEYKQKQDQYVGELNSPGISYSTAEYHGEDFGFDELYVYDSFFNAVILIRDGNTVIRAVCGLHTWGDSDALFPLWLGQMAEKLA